MDDNSTESVVARAEVPYGHKIAVQPCTRDASVLEYGVRIGVATSEIELGDYVHTHNLKTARWERWSGTATAGRTAPWARGTT
jgi:(2R)-sulfolactate sulfo-lyase subunit alpha